MGICTTVFNFLFQCNNVRRKKDGGVNFGVWRSNNDVGIGRQFGKNIVRNLKCCDRWWSVKDLLEEYGILIISIVAIGVLVVFLPKLKYLYEVAGNVFLNMIGG